MCHICNTSTYDLLYVYGCEEHVNLHICRQCWNTLVIAMATDVRLGHLLLSNCTIIHSMRLT